jgi:hypothetical protein
MRSERGAAALRLRALSNSEHKTKGVTRALIALCLAQSVRFNRDLSNLNLGESAAARHSSELHEYLSGKVTNMCGSSKREPHQVRKPGSKYVRTSLVWVAIRCVANTGWEHEQHVDNAVVRRRVECVKDTLLPVEAQR